MIGIRVAIAALMAVAVFAEAPAAATEQRPAAKAPRGVTLDLGAQETDEAFLQASSKARFASALTANAHSRAMWRFGGNFQPQHYGLWHNNQGTWVFGNDKRVECEACSYVLYMLIDRLGDQFSRATISTEAALLCPRVQWVFRSACELIVMKNQNVVADLIMRLVEPVDICKHINLCTLEPHDFMALGLSGPHGYGGLLHNGGAGHGMPFHGGAPGYGHPAFPYGRNSMSPYGPYGPYGMYGMSSYDQYGVPLAVGSHHTGSESGGGSEDGGDSE
ncbi:hypothetical protein FNF27_05067 [Cafeteria roenbergensis]|uniref:Saposin B-type domain-containing protein n=1 Tax=Cafeteria roenbergensis TaxID=33653 RepID=A0A5A8E9Q1_CAFRO|nr:hypothetical protein FNF31_05414 [Cafeteria roenbergensis]KAA0160003.1 hypothetical protein FNF28_05583 [Cafeteria roenbergensis]KAA0173427.1 hypothetical protein FNF27_05067 [Cafeteria roenbergensis]